MQSPKELGFKYRLVLPERVDGFRGGSGEAFWGNSGRPVGAVLG
jgi:hypothetical protein